MTRLSRLSSGGCPPALWGLRIPSPRVACEFGILTSLQVSRVSLCALVKPSQTPAGNVPSFVPTSSRLAPVLHASSSSQEGALEGVTSRQSVTTWCAPRWAVLAFLGVSAWGDSATALVERMLSP